MKVITDYEVSAAAAAQHEHKGKVLLRIVDERGEVIDVYLERPDANSLAAQIKAAEKEACKKV